MMEMCYPASSGYDYFGIVVKNLELRKCATRAIIAMNDRPCLTAVSHDTSAIVGVMSMTG
jgi:hypothetical protein